MRLIHSLDTLARDLRYAARTLSHNLGFTLLAVLTLTLGIGVNTAVFSVINAVLLRQPPYTDPGRLVTLRQKFPKLGEISLGACPAEYLDYRDRTRAFSSFAGYETDTFDLTGQGEPLRIEAVLATHTVFRTLGVAPFAGRTSTAAEDRPGGARVAILNYDFWRKHFGGSLKAIGSAIRLNDQPYTIIGIMPAGFAFPFTPSSVGQPPALWLPLSFTAEQIQDRAAEFPVNVVARLKPGVSFAQAAQDVTRVAREFQHERSDIYSGDLRLEVILQGLGAESAARTRPILLTLAGAVLCVLLIACANVMNLLLARGAVRQREMAVRTALGASRGRLLSQLLTEGLLITAAGGALGCVFAYALLEIVAQAWPAFIAGLAQVHIDTPVLLFTLGLSILTGLLCTAAPAFDWWRREAAATLKQGGRPGTSHSRHRLRGILVVAEAASAVVLLIGAGLLIHSFLEVLRVPLGFSPGRVLIARTTFNRRRYPSNDVRRQTERHMVQRLAALPGVDAVALTTHIPLADERQIGFTLEGEDSHSAHWADNALVSDNYFAVMGIPLLRGRTFGPQDQPGNTLSAIVNESMARRFWPSGDALGKRFSWGGLMLTVVGVAGDVRIQALDAVVAPAIYFPVYQQNRGATSNAVFLLRTDLAEAASLAHAVRASIWSLDPGLPVFDFRTMSQVVAGSLSARRFAVALLSLFAVLALALAMIGLYGVLSYSVTQRTSELGLRFAIGATPAQVLRLVLRDGLRLTTIGVLLGVLLGAGAARAMSGLLFGIRTFDLTAFVLSPALLLLVALLASAIPARRAARVDPMVALRSE